MNTVWGDIRTKTNRIRASFILGAAILTGAGCLWNASLETAPEKNEEKSKKNHLNFHIEYIEKKLIIRYNRQ